MKIKLYILLIISLSITFLNSLVNSQTKPPIIQKWNFVFGKLEFARDIQVSFNDQTTVVMLNSAEINLRRARRQIEAKHRLLALRLINNADDSINKALIILLREPIKKRRQKLENQIQEVKDALETNNIQEAKDVLEKGLENKRLAEQSFKEGQFQKSLKHFRRAEFQIQKALDIIKNRDKSIQDKVTDESNRFDQLMSQAKPIISASPDQTVQKNHSDAIKLSQKAQKAKSDGNFRLAIDFYHQATRLLLRTIDIAEGKTDHSVARAYEEVAALDELMENLQQKVKPYEDDERIQFFMSHLEQLQEDAHQALEDKDYKLALLNTQYARDLIERIHKRLRGGRDEMYPLIDQELKQLDVDLNDINDRILTEGNNEEAKLLLTYAVIAKNKAEELFETQKYRLARESILIANRFAFAADRLIRKQNSDEISSGLVMNKIQTVEKDLSFIQSAGTNFASPEIQIYFDHAQKMLNRAHENYNKGYFYVANECIESSKTAIKKLRTLKR